MRKLNLENVEEAREFKKVRTGLYFGRIMKVEDEEEKEYLKLFLDIADGEFKNYYKQLNDAKGFWGLRTIKSYKESALSFFKGFVTAVEKSNKNYKFNEDNWKDLEGKYLGLALAEEEYKKNDGTVGVRIYVHSIRSIEAIKKGDIEVPDTKRLATSNTDMFVAVDDDDEDTLPF